MNRERLLKALKSAGFTGKSIEDVLVFVKDNAIELKPKGAEKALDEAAIKAAWDVVKAVEVEPEPVVEKKAVEIDDEPAAEPSAETLLRKSRAATASAAKAAPAIANGERSMARKSYEKRIKSNESVFSTVEDAEFAGADLRLKLMALKGWDYPQKANDLAIVGKASSEYNNASAGVLVAPQYSAEVIWLTEKYGTARKLANVQRFSGTDEWRRPRKTGILSMSYVGEGAQATAADNTYDLVTLTPKKLMALMVVSNELLNDAAVSIADEFAKTIAESQAKAEDNAYFLGDGTSTYGGQSGLISALPSGAYINASGGTWASITLADLDNMPGSVVNVDPTRFAYVSSRQFFHQVAKRLARAAGGVTAEEIVKANGLNSGSGPDATFGGYPWYFAQVMPTATAATTKSCYFGDFMGASMLGIHTDVRIAVDNSLKFDYDQVAFRAVSRIAVNIHGDGRASTVGPIAALVTT